MPSPRRPLHALRVLAGILAVPFGLLAVLGLVCAVIGVVMVFTRDDPWSTPGIFAVVGVVSGLITWGLAAATTPGIREGISNLLDVLELLQTIGRGIWAVGRGVGALFRVFS